MSLARRLYRGETAFPLIQRRRRFYGISIALVAISLASMLLQGFNLGVEFKGGSTFQFPANGHTVAQARDTFEGIGIADPEVEELGRPNTSAKDLRVQTQTLTQDETDKAITAIQKDFGVTADQVNPSSVGAAWGKQVTNKALQGLFFFLVAVIIYISVRFEPKMAVAAIVALVHDLILTAGIYSITQFVVTPSTIIALLTVLGYSLYDTIVVFDKVEENTRGLAGSSRSTYSEAAELAVNQTFMRSINTSLIALLPVSGLLFVGAFLLGAGTLKDLALALFVGLASGAYSSLFLATPLLADLKEREPQYRALAARVAARRTGTGRTSLRSGAARRGGSVPVAAAGDDEGGSVADTEAAEAAPVGAGRAGSAPIGTASPGTAAGSGTAGSGAAGTGARAARRPGGTPPRKGGRPAGKRRR